MARTTRCFLLCSVGCLLMFSARSQPPKIIITAGDNLLYGVDTTGNSGVCQTIPYQGAICYHPGSSTTLNSVARYKDTIYYNNVDGFFFRSVGTACTQLPLEDNTISLTTDAAGNLIFVTVLDSLVRYNPHTGLRENLGRVNYTPSGDLIFYQQNLLMSSDNGFLVQVNMEHPEQSTIFMDLGGLQVYGLANLSTNCQETYILAFAFSLQTGRTTIVELDLFSKKIVKTFCSMPQEILDAASEYESGGYGLSNTIFATKDTVACTGSTIVLDGGAGFSSYNWDDNSTAETRSVSRTGRYSVTVEKDGCTASDTINADIIDPPPYSFGGDTAVCSSDPFQLYALGDHAVFQWQDATSLYVYDVTRSGNYSVNVTNKCGSRFSSIDVERMDCICSLYVPNAFSPNRDGVNDVFRATPRCLLNGRPHNYTFRVFNRYGSEVFRSHSPQTGWPGTFNGVAQPVGTYTWEISYRNAESGEQFNKKGTVELLH